MTAPTANLSSSDKIWLISEAGEPSFDVQQTFGKNRIKSIKEYTISDLARYMISPSPVKIENRLVGCEIIHSISQWEEFKLKVKNLFSKQKKKATLKEIVTPALMPASFNMGTEGFNRHMEKIYGLLGPFDPMAQRLISLFERGLIKDVNGICEDLEGNRSITGIPGKLDAKIDFITNSIFKKIPLVVERPYFKGGLFEMRPFDFKNFNPQNRHRLIRFIKDGNEKLGIINHDNKMDFLIDQVELITYLQLFELALKGNDQLQQLLKKNCEGTSTTLKILFNPRIKTSYSQENLPLRYRQMEETGAMGLKEKMLIAKVLNQNQFSLSINYLVQGKNPSPKPITSIFIMQDLKALDSIKLLVPQLYSSINQSSVISEAGTFYMVDSIKGVKDEQSIQ